MDEPERIVTSWCDAITRRDKDAFLGLCHEAVAFYGPEGAGVGHEVVSDWFDAEPMRITIKDMRTDGLTVRLDHHIDWLDANGDVEYEADNAAQIEIRDAKVYSYRRVEEPPHAAEDPVVSP